MKKSVFLISILFCIAGYAQEIENEKITINYDKEKLLSGELQTFEFVSETGREGKKNRIIGVLLINAPPEKVWELLSDWDSMPGYVPGLESQKTVLVTKKTGDGRTAESIIATDLEAAVFLTITYTLCVKFDKNNLRQEWTLLSDTEIDEFNKTRGLQLEDSTMGIKNIEGFEYIEPYDDGKKTLYYYAPVVEVSIPVPGFIERALSEKSLSDFMLAVKKKAELDTRGKMIK